MRHLRRGVTLIELVVVLAILGIMAAVAGLSMHTAPPPPVSPILATIAALRDSALVSGHPVTATIPTDTTVYTVTAYPDGHVVSDLDTIERTTGRPRATP